MKDLKSLSDFGHYLNCCSKPNLLIDYLLEDAKIKVDPNMRNYKIRHSY